MDWDAAGNILIANGAFFGQPSPSYTQPNVVELFKLDSDGNTIWKKGLPLTKNGQSIGNLICILKVINTTSDGSYIIGHFATNISYEKGPQFIIKLDTLGNPVKWKLFKDAYFYDMIATDDGIYVWDKNSHFSVLENFNFKIDGSSVRLMKLNHDLSLVWAKSYKGENFEYFSASLTRTNSGKLVMGHTTYGNFPAVLSEIDGNGNLLSQKGYPNYLPNLFALSDGSLVLASADLTSVNARNPIIAKTDPDGNITGCPIFPTCLYSEDTNVEFEDFEIEVIDIGDLEDFAQMELTPVTATFQPYCDYPSAPEPSFVFPDTIFCLEDSAATSLTDGNRLAQAREWHLIGPGTDSLLRDSFEFSYQFHTPGEYLLKQTIWVLGCAYSHERSITVLPPFSVSVSADSLVCPNEQIAIMVEASRAASYLWSNGQTGQTPFVTASGTYAVTATDGHCEATDSTSMVIVADLLNGNPPFTLPPDTTTCFPYDLVPQSQFSNLFYTDADPTPRPSIRLEAAGNYRIGMMAFGCEFWEDYEYGVDCHVDVYLPTSFSPNGDGINDVFMPFGNLFEVLEMRVYDRWGGLLHQGRNPQGGTWDGGKAGQGVYLYELRYLNLRSGLEEEVNGQVLLVK